VFGVKLTLLGQVLQLAIETLAFFSHLALETLACA